MSNRFKNHIEKDFEVEVTRSEKYISTKVKFYKDEIRTDSHDD